MGDPQPRGFRQAPLKPSDIFFELDLVNQPSGERWRCPTRKITRSLNGNSKPGGFSDLTHNGTAPKRLLEAPGGLRLPREPDGLTSTPTTGKATIYSSDKVLTRYGHHY